MTKKLAALAVLTLLTACRSAFAPEAVTRVSAPPEAEHSATISKATDLRRGPSREAPSSGALEAGASVQVSSDVVHGFRRVKLADGKTGYVDERAISMSGGGQAAPAASAAQQAP